MRTMFQWLRGTSKCTADASVVPALFSHDDDPEVVIPSVIDPCPVKHEVSDDGNDERESETTDHDRQAFSPVATSRISQQSTSD